MKLPRSLLAAALGFNFLNVNDAEIRVAKHIPRLYFAPKDMLPRIFQGNRQFVALEHSRLTVIFWYLGASCRFAAGPGYPL
jgi:hypothetical protein